MIQQAALPAPQPRVTAETRPFWEAAAAGRLLLPRCRACGWVIWYPRKFCNACGSLDIEWIEASGQGSLYSFTIVRRGEGAYHEAVPYVLAYVDLDEGPRLLTNIVSAELVDLRIGMPVVVTFQPAGDGGTLIRFRPRARGGQAMGADRVPASIAAGGRSSSVATAAEGAS